MARHTCAQPTSLETGISSGWAWRKLMTKQHHYDLCKADSDCNWSLSNTSQAESLSSSGPLRRMSHQNSFSHFVQPVESRQSRLCYRGPELKTKLLTRESHFCFLTLRGPPEIKMLNAEKSCNNQHEMPDVSATGMPSLGSLQQCIEPENTHKGAGHRWHWRDKGVFLDILLSLSQSATLHNKRPMLFA